MSSTLNVKLTVGDAPLAYGLPAKGRIRVAFGTGSSDEAAFQHFTDEAGTVSIELLPAGFYRIHPLAEGYQADPVDVEMPHDEQIVIAMTKLPAPGESGFLGTAHYQHDLLHYFVDDKNQPWQMRGYTAHLLPARVLQGRDIRPFIREAQSYDANTLITIGTHLSPWKTDHGFRFDPRTQQAKDALVTMFDVGAEMGMRFAHGVAADMQYGLTDAEKRRIWDEQCELADGRWNLLWRCGNETRVNGWDPSLFPQKNLHGVLQSAGSTGENTIPIQQYRDFSEWQSRRSPWHKVLDDSGAGIFEQNNGYNGGGQQVGPFPCPIVMIEGIYFADTDPDHVGDARETDPQKALMVGLQIGASCAGGGVGCSRGLEGDPNGPVAAECARQQFRGMQAAFLR